MAPGAPVAESHGPTTTPHQHAGDPSSQAVNAYTFIKDMPTAKLSSGYSIPLVGLGTWKSGPGEVKAAVMEAVRCGYRHIDCAAIYGNEKEVGAALSELFAEGVVSREQLFITTKLWNTDHSDVEGAIRRSLEALQLEYLDLYLIHWPVVTGCVGPEMKPSLAETWAAMEDCVAKGLTRSIGVSNVSRVKLQALLDSPSTKIKPAVLQVEAHPYWTNQALVSWALSVDVHVTAYSPLGSPDGVALLKEKSSKKVEQPQLMHHPLVTGIAKRLGKSAAQVLIRWALQRGTSVLPKSANPQRIKANIDVLSWSLPDDDMRALGILSEVTPQRACDGLWFIHPEGPYRSMDELWDEPQPDHQALRQQMLAKYNNLDKQQPTATLNSGAVMPLLGLGTWKSEPGQVRAAVLAAVRCGYRHIDCAAIYGNEVEVGAALSELFAEGVVSREQLFITSKLWNSKHAAQDVKPALQKTLSDLGLSYVDLYLIHWPVTGNVGPVLEPSIAETWAAMEDCAAAGLAHNIGVSNFSIPKLQALLDNPSLKIKPAVNQVEAHPYWPNDALVSWCASHDVHVTAYSPLGSPDSATMLKRDDTKRLLQDPQLLSIAAKYDKSPAQVLIRWAIQRGTMVLPKSANADRIAANFDVLDWQLKEEDQQALSSLPHRERMVSGSMWLHREGPYRTMQELWDE